MLVIVSSVLQGIVSTRRFSVGIILAEIIRLCWSVINSVLIVLFVIVFIRLIVSVLNRDTSPIWSQIDKMISPVAYRLTNMVFPRKYVKYQTVLLVALVALIVSYILIQICLGFIADFFTKLPF